MMQTNAKIPAIEIFPSIQGEGIFAGRKTYFVRLWGCDNNCSWCDEGSHRDPSAPIIASNVEEVMRYLDRNVCKVVTLTGGNPCIRDLTDLTKTLKENGFEIHIETQGTAIPGWLRNVDFITLSPKGPSSGNPTDLLKLQQKLKNFKGIALQFKIVVMIHPDGSIDKFDMETLRKVVRMWPKNYVIAQLGDNGSEQNIATYTERYGKLCNYILEDPELKNVRILPQLHKLAGG